MSVRPRNKPPPLLRHIHVFSLDQRAVWRAVCCARVRVGGLGPQELAAVEALDGRGRCISLECSPQMRPLVGESQSSRTLVRSGSAQGLLVGKAVMMKLECFISFTPKKCWSSAPCRVGVSLVRVNTKNWVPTYLPRPGKLNVDAYLPT